MDPVAHDATTGEPIFEEQARITDADGKVYLLPNYPDVVVGDVVVSAEVEVPMVPPVPPLRVK